MLQSAAECCRVLQSVAECCSVVQCGTVCYRVLQGTIRTPQRCCLCDVDRPVQLQGDEDP